MELIPHMAAPHVLVMIALGFALHVFGRLDEHHSQMVVRPVSIFQRGALAEILGSFFADRPFRWVASVLGILAIATNYEALAPLVGVDPNAAGAGLMTGYAGSSVVAKLAGRFGPKGGA